jgi:two-component system NtrC family sensor kinase
VEDTNTANIEARSPKNLLVFCHDLDSREQLGTISKPNFSILENMNQSNVFIQKAESNFILKYYVSKKYKIQIVKPINLELTLKKLSQVIKPRLEFSPSLQNVTDSMLKKTINWGMLHTLIVDLNQNFLSSKNINEFTQSLLSLEIFQSFKTIHLFLHEKGMRASKHIQITKASYSESVQNVAEFTQLYNAIKKSKNRSFGQSTLKASNHSIIGTCLAHELSLQKFNIIFLISNDDFLPQEEKDIQAFSKTIPILKFFFNQILTEDISNKNINLNRLLLNQLNANSDESNESISILKDDVLIQNIEDVLNTIQKNNFNSADVNHQERISLLGELLNTLKHELSNPLFGLQLTTELLLLEDLVDDQQMFVQEIALAIKRSQSIIHSFSEMYNDNPSFESVDLIQLLKEVITLTKSESKAISKIIILEEDVAQDNDQLYLKTNQTWLAQVLFNLIINSTQALNNSNTLKPQIKISLSKKVQVIEISVRDNGPGLKSASIKDAFKPFFTTKDAGTGLGLTISTSLISKLSGTIEYIDNDNGAHFLLRLPYENTDN